MVKVLNMESTGDNFSLELYTFIRNMSHFNDWKHVLLFL